MFDFLSFSLIPTVLMIDNEFPPNPEDGEQWLPSDVFHEIDSVGEVQDFSPRSRSSTHMSAADGTGFVDPFDHVVGLGDPNGVTERPYRYHQDMRGLGRLMMGYYSRPWMWVKANYYTWRSQFGHTQINGGARVGGGGGGTGVFFPRHHRRPSMEAELKLAAASSVAAGTGTGVYINHHKPHYPLPHPPPPPPHKRTMSCGVNMQSNWNNNFNGGIVGGNGHGNYRRERIAVGGRPPSAVISDQTVHLPDDGIY